MFLSVLAETGLFKNVKKIKKKKRKNHCGLMSKWKS